MSSGFHHPFQEGQFDIFDWYPKFQSCLRYFVDHAQHSAPVQSVAALVNIRLPFETGISSRNSAATPRASNGAEVPVPLVPYVRRLVATGFDNPAILHGFFGDDWREGVGPIHETERRNYLFAAKSETWLRVKDHYDMENGQLVPFLRPLQSVSEKEIQAAESNWSEWLAMQDWMLGPRAPPDVGGGRNRIKTEDD